MVTMEASVDEEVFPYLEHLASILGSFENAIACSLRAYFVSLQSQDNPTYDTFEDLLIKEKERVIGAMRARNDSSVDGDTVFRLELADDLGQSLKNYIEIFNSSPDEIFLTAILALSVVEEMLEADPEAYFLLEGQKLSFSFLMRTKDDSPQKFH